YMALPAWLSACARQGGTPLPPFDPAAWAAESAAEQPALLHLLQRLTYGPAPGDLERLAAMGGDAFIEQQLHPEQIDDSDIERRLAGMETLTLSANELYQRYPPKGKPGPQAIVQELWQASLLRAVYSRRQLHEIMVDFWSNHLHSSIEKGEIKWLK